jgi:hypothetical protein
MQNHTVEHIKRLTSRIKKELGIPHHEALDEASRQCGFSNWQHFLRSKNLKANHVRNKLGLGYFGKPN